MAASPAPPDDRANKRIKPDENGGGTQPGNESNGMPPYGQMPPQGQRYPPYAGGPPPPTGGPSPMGWSGQYGNPPPPHAWAGGQHGGQFPPGGMPPDRPGFMAGGFRSPNKNKSRKDDGTADGDEAQAPTQPYWGHGGGHGPPPQQWHAGPYGPSPGYPTGPPPMHQAMYGGSSGQWTGGGTKTPPRGRSRPDYSSGGHRENSMDMYLTRTVGAAVHDDDGASSSAGGSAAKEKGRGSYKCGRCGVPKKGHVCPYQPKLKRRPDQPPPELRNAAVQVEMDEFMTLRRLNIKIQGFPESYKSEPYLDENMVVGEPRPPPSMPAEPPRGMMPVGDESLAPEPLVTSSSPRASPSSMPLEMADADVSASPTAAAPEPSDSPAPAEEEPSTNTAEEETGSKS